MSGCWTSALWQPAGRRYNGDVMNEPEPPPAAELCYDCPYCDGQLLPLRDHPDLACNLCGRRFDAEMLYAYKDAEDAFVEGHHNVATMAKRRIEPRRDLLETETSDLFRLAYNKLRTAIRYQLPEVYRLAAIEMLAEITLFFSERAMTSRYEAGYWHRLLIEVDDDRAISEIEVLLAKPLRGPLDPFKRVWARYQRRRKLNRLRLIDRQIVELEEIMGFVEPPHIRRRSRYLSHTRARAK